jgi:hypothetical protein
VQEHDPQDIPPPGPSVCGWSVDQLDYALSDIPDSCEDPSCKECENAVRVWLDLRRALGILHWEGGHA